MTSNDVQYHLAIVSQFFILRFCNLMYNFAAVDGHDTADDLDWSL